MDVPVSEAHNPRGLRYIIDFLHPGTIIRRRIFIENQEPHTERFAVYADAARITKGYFIGDRGRTRSELTTWITIRHPRVTLAPGASILDLVTIKVPRIATRGEHYGVIWVQQSAHAHNTRGVAILEVARVGIRIYLAIGKGGAPPTKFDVTAIVGHRSPKGVLFLTAKVNNTGGRAIDVSGSARLTNGPGGTTAGPFPAEQVLTLAPGQSDQVTFVVPKRLPIGPLQASVKLVSGLNVRFASATISFSNHPIATSWLQPGMALWVGAGVVALLAIGLGWRLSRPRGLRGLPFRALRTH